MLEYSLLIGISLLPIVLGSYRVNITHNSPVVPGAAIDFTATIYDGSALASGSFKFVWIDTAVPQHQRTESTSNPTDKWVVQYTKNNPPGAYVMQVEVYRVSFLLPWFLASERIYFYLSETLDGDLNLYQRNSEIKSEFVANDSTVTHQVKLSDPDQKYLNETATSVYTYWFLDCSYLGVTNDYQLSLNYTNTDVTHTIDALVLADFSPPPTTTTTTTTTMTTPTTSKTTPTTATTTTLKPPTSTPSNKTSVSISKREANSYNGSEIVGKFHGKLVTSNTSSPETVPFICSNNTIVPIGPNFTYGYFSRDIIIKEPVTDVVVTGSNWVQRGELLELRISCNGSPNFKYCYHFHPGSYNVTGNETCYVPDAAEQCRFVINRLFVFDISGTETVVIIISNDVKKIVYPVKITLYTVSKQAQLSVIVVPVTFSLVAMVLIIFGVAYYLQNRTRFTVEVADFNFGQPSSELEYKTFTERLQDSIKNAFTRAPLPSTSSAEGPIWPPGNKYGTMT